MTTTTLGMRRLRAAFVSALLLVFAGCSSSGLPDTDRVFLSAAGGWDRNRDGVVTCDEWKAYATELFNGDTGGMSPEPTRNELTLTPQESGTLMSVVITYPSAEVRDIVLATGMTDGMEASYARLESVLA